MILNTFQDFLFQALLCILDTHLWHGVLVEGEGHIGTVALRLALGT